MFLLTLVGRQLNNEINKCNKLLNNELNLLFKKKTSKKMVFQLTLVGRSDLALGRVADECAQLAGKGGEEPTVIRGEASFDLTH